MIALWVQAVVVLALVVSSYFTGLEMSRRQCIADRNRDIAIEIEQKRQIEQENATTEKQLLDQKHKIETEYEKQQQELDRIMRDNRNLSNDIRMLIARKDRSCPRVPAVATTAKAGDGTEGGPELFPESVQRDLDRLVEAASRTAGQLASCQAWIASINLKVTEKQYVTD